MRGARNENSNTKRQCLGLFKYIECMKKHFIPMAWFAIVFLSR